MSQYYALPRFSLGHAPRGTKLLIGLFCVSTLAALWLGVHVFFQDTGYTAEGVRTWLLGNEDDPNAQDLRFAMPERELLELLHIHSFTALILAFVVFHFLGLVRIVSDRVKVPVYVLGFLGLLGMLAMPWIVRFHAPELAWAVLVAGGTFVASVSIATLLTCAELAARRARR